MTSASKASDLFAGWWPDIGPTPLLDRPDLARLCGVGRVLVKDESRRRLGNFKSLGGVHAALKALARATGARDIPALLAGHRRPGPLPVLVCASAGNHGLAVAAGAAMAGTRARIYVGDDVPAGRLRRIVEKGAEVVHVAGTYDEAVEAAVRDAASGEALLVADTTEAVHDPVTDDILAGYDLVAEEMAAQATGLGVRPTHLFVQAGVGGLAAAMARGLSARLDGPLRIVVAEPEAAACGGAGLEAGRAVQIAGDLATSAGMLACGLASAPAIEVLLALGAKAIAVNEAMLDEAVDGLEAEGGPVTSPSGATGLAGLMAARGRVDLGLDADSQVLVIVSEMRPPA